MTALKEEGATSLPFPADPEEWEAVHTTSTTGKFEPNIASTQFNEDLYKLPDGLIKVEYESRIRLQRTITPVRFWRQVFYKTLRMTSLKRS